MNIQIKLLLEIIHLLKMIAHRAGTLSIQEMADLEERVSKLTKSKKK